MIIKTGSLFLKRTEESDPELSSLIQDLDTASGVSESRLFPELPKSILFRIEKDNRLIGEIGFKNIKWVNRKAELNVIIKKEYRNRGYAKEALSELIEYGFMTLNFHRLEAEVYDYNKTSIRLVEKIGFISEGALREAKYYNGEYHSILRYGLLKKEWQKNNDQRLYV
jgi:RimJ/RimL family protein N-acetyltransferase